jgi:demethylmenaquinone methyltransferase/2-methoxy-6-polyprenyl-1,4-benzoquinol methylase
VTRSKDQARRSYDALSKIYDHLSSSAERGFILRTIEMLGLHQGARVLEIGFGTGEAVLEIARRTAPDGRVCGIDISPGMRQLAVQKVRREGLTERVELVLGDGAALPYREDAFDAAFMSFTLELFDTPEIPAVLGECRRVLRPGGRLGVVAMTARTEREWPVKLYRWFHANIGWLVDCRPIDARRAVEKAGFAIDAHRVEHVFRLPIEIVVAQSAKSGRRGESS